MNRKHKEFLVPYLPYKLYCWFGVLSAWLFKKAFVGETGDITKRWGWLSKITAKTANWIFVRWISPRVREWKKELRIYSLEDLLEWFETDEGENDES